MISNCAHLVRLRYFVVVGLLGVAPWSTATAQEPDAIVRVEEDWELVLGNPDPSVDAPQITCTMSPTSTTSALHAAFELNHRSQPSFTAGGIQVQVWRGENLLSTRTSTRTAELATAGETVTWTQTMDLEGSYLAFELKDGASSTWGSFGRYGYLRTYATTSLTNLNGYHPDVSVANSGIGFAGNRVTSLVLKEVRLITASGETLRDTTPRVVH